MAQVKRRVARKKGGKAGRRQGATVNRAKTKSAMAGSGLNAEVNVSRRSLPSLNSMASAVRSRTRERDMGFVFYDFLLLFTGARVVSPPRIRNDSIKARPKAINAPEAAGGGLRAMVCS